MIPLAPGKGQVVHSYTGALCGCRLPAKYSHTPRFFGNAYSISTQSHALGETGFMPALLVGLRSLMEHWPRTRGLRQ